ncbi:Ger(x)C family spore germination protein [Heliophilum fasciatum]|uniref:Spore germination protein KC n=1 Tax=Heliophilum fasciatum TaxID=35700 RepID=A0A4R2RLZ5_9FIRM|nr:Ger(x)C family spore germination protein [Heliophilum fasciatum]MCW2277622.1 spore germination protein KC [Heliophilum fasciatum]TCP64970.1 spore germination protein KC [Heliophilum fasciatum]
MKKTKIVLLLIVILTVALTGCWNRRELNDLAIVVGIGIDKKDSHYVFTVQVINQIAIQSQTKVESRAPVVTYRIETDTIFEGIRRLTTVSPRKLFFAHLRLVVLGEVLARQGIEEVVDFLVRDHEFRGDFFFIVARETTAAEVLEIITPAELIPSVSFYRTLSTSARFWAPTHSVQLAPLVTDLLTPGKNPVITGLVVVGNSPSKDSTQNVQKSAPPTQVLLFSIGLFHNGRLVAWLNEGESKGYNYIVNKISSSVAPIDGPDGQNIILEISNSTTKLRSQNQDGRPMIMIEVNTEANLGEINVPIDLKRPGALSDLERSLENKISSYIFEAIAKAKSYQTDVFGFGGVIHRADPQTWKRLQPNWDQEFVNLPVEIVARVKIKKSGDIVTPLREAIQKSKRAQ